jgi:hypothetical protein
VQDFTSLYPSPENFVSTSGHQHHQYECSAVAQDLLSAGRAVDMITVIRHPSSTAAPSDLPI